MDVGNNRQGRVPASAPQVELIRPTCSRAGLRDHGGGETTAADIEPYSLDARGRSVGIETARTAGRRLSRRRRHGVPGRLVVSGAPRYRRGMLEQDLAIYTP